MKLKNLSSKAKCLTYNSIRLPSSDEQILFRRENASCQSLKKIKKALKNPRHQKQCLAIKD